MNLILFSGIFGVVMMYSGFMVKRKRNTTYLAIVLMAVLFLLNLLEWNTGKPLFSFPTEGFLNFTNYSLLVNLILIGACLFFFILSGRELEEVGHHPSDYYALLFFIMCGVGITTSFTNLLMLFLGIEIMSIPLYVLVGSDKKNLKSNEASLKYFLMGSFTTGILLMGIALIYGVTGTFMIEGITTPTGNASVVFGGVIGGLLLVLFALSFKVGVAPFHFWTPDVYDGAPTVFTSFMATVIKIGAFAGFIKLFISTHTVLEQKWYWVLAIIIALTLVIGNVTAVFQQSVKRMLAYSSISQAGFMMFALFAFNNYSKEGFILYAVAYSLATIGIFAVLAKLDDYTYDGFNGLGKSHPWIALCITVFTLSLAGIPLTLGFFGKYYMLAAGITANSSYLWLFILAVICAAISVYYYFRIIQAMYFKSYDNQFPVFTNRFSWTLGLMAVLIVLLGVMPQLVLQFMYF